MGLRLLAAAALLLAAAQQSAAGRYELKRINRTQLPVYRQGFTGSGGTSIRSGILELGADGRFSATVVTYTVATARREVDTLVASGTWAVHRDSVAIDYTWTRRGSAAVSDRIIGAVNASTISLPRLGFLNPWWFGARAGQIRWLRFDRTAAGRRS